MQIWHLPQTAETLVPSLVHSTARRCGGAEVAFPRCPLRTRVPGLEQDTWMCQQANWPHQARIPLVRRVASPCRGHNRPHLHLYHCLSCSDDDTYHDASGDTCPYPVVRETFAAPSACSACRRR